MTTYTAQYVSNLGEIPAKIGDNVLYYIDGTIGTNVPMSEWQTDNEGQTSLVSLPPAANGIIWESNIPVASELEEGTWSNDKTTNNTSDSKHGYLITQQVIAQGKLNGVYAVDIEGRRIYGEYYWKNGAMSNNNYAGGVTINGKLIPRNQMIEGRVIPFPLNNDYTLHKQLVKDNMAEFKEPFKDSVRIHVFREGGTADPLVTENDSRRGTALFTGCSYATGVYYLNRDDPQFGGGTTPDTQFYVEGLLSYSVVKTIDVYSLSASKDYSNNPARCLLDYLTNTEYGRGLSLSQIDLKSFYVAQEICNQIVVTNVPSEGAFWQGKSLVLGTHDVRLYECNITLDSAAPIRDNITAILATMNDAKLVWSDGKYKLTLAYPAILPTLDGSEWSGSGTWSELTPSS
jgi:hypothetical protein